MYRWMEVWSYIYDFGVPHWIEEWELVSIIDDRKEEEEKYAKLSKSLASQRLSHTVRVPTGVAFLAVVEDFFSIPSK